MQILIGKGWGIRDGNVFTNSTPCELWPLRYSWGQVGACLHRKLDERWRRSYLPLVYVCRHSSHPGDTGLQACQAGQETARDSTSWQQDFQQITLMFHHMETAAREKMIDGRGQSLEEERRGDGLGIHARDKAYLACSLLCCSFCPRITGPSAVGDQNECECNRTHMLT